MGAALLDRAPAAAAAVVAARLAGLGLDLLLEEDDLGLVDGVVLDAADVHLRTRARSTTSNFAHSTMHYDGRCGKNHRSVFLQKLSSAQYDI